ncbi:MAG: Flp pilus assembly protein CpaB [Clostridia bacterium]|nr:Flp pilus assembly protein CpaB [Clostridia bacterium]
MKKTKSIGSRKMGNRTIIGILCVIAALAICFGVAPLVNRAKDGRTSIVRISKTVTRGSLVTENDIETVSVGSYHIPQGVLTKPSDVVGKYATCDLYAGDYLFPMKLTSDVDTAMDILDVLDENHKAISVSIGTFAAGVSGKLETGDIISVIVYSAKDGFAFTPPELSYVKVITSTTSSGIDKADVKDHAQPVTVTLLVNQEQAELLAQYEKTASMHFTLEYRGDAATAQRYLDAQEAYFAERG